MQFRCNKCDKELEVEVVAKHFSSPAQTNTALVQPCSGCTVSKDKAEELADEYWDECENTNNEIDAVRDMLDRVHDRLGDLEGHLDRVKEKDLLEDLT